MRDRSRSLKARLRDFLLITGEAQQLFDSENMAELAAFCTGSLAISAETNAGFRLLGSCRLPVLTGSGNSGTGLACAVEQWEQAPELLASLPKTRKLERIAVSLRWHLLKAVNDGDLLGRAQFCALGVLVTDRLSRFGELPEALRLFSREIEHNEENLDTLLEQFWQTEGLSLSALLAAFGG
ncbi:MAG: hypothetical protein ACLU38_12605 [Dysosmobacter sp.]